MKCSWSTRISYEAQSSATQNWNATWGLKNYFGPNTFCVSAVDGRHNIIARGCVIPSAPHCEAAATNHSTADLVLITAQRWRTFISTNLTLNSTSMARPGRLKIVTEAELHAEPVSFISFLSTELALSPSLQQPIPESECKGSLAVKLMQTREIWYQGAQVRTVWSAIKISDLVALKVAYCRCTLLCQQCSSDVTIL